MEQEEDEEERKRKKHITVRCLVAFWIFGLCNNYGYTIMLAAATDIIGKTGGERSKHRDCTYMSTGAILLADIIPGFVMKTFAPFFPFFGRARITFCIVLSACGLIVVAFSPNMVVSLLGVCITSLSAGLGEVTFLQYTNFFTSNVISTWSSGTGGAGVIGSGSYALLQYLGFRTVLMIMLLIPALMTITFFIILPKPEINETTIIQKNFNVDEIKKPKEILMKKVNLLPGLVKYMVPFGLVYYFEYFINQGTFELVNFKNIFFTVDDQYRWLQVCYQLGVFAARSSVNIVRIKPIWILTILQGVNVVIFTTEVIFYYMPSFWILVFLGLWEGLLGGATYVNTFYRIAHEVEEEDKQFSMGITSFASSLGKVLAGITAIYAHNAICDLPYQ